ncbi:unnamed protein product [Didymodactylos carnosus]|uniref:Peptidase S8/S53 domain-containing protein n=1 Tax=Didymodactylos carnosus TaxID=1234261 RepID=A0A816BZU0_9BILA|nr:unnamed protein product [Didymodactylos carnosus]CAF1616947.1 unnamed protein product [Didymodactylos carnosus]CAF4368705.1 unnamed protein product [Didymodactylos carnosus]CAF4504291.1 unnamed protein product [Didymodactylos carnosus]
MSPYESRVNPDASGENFCTKVLTLNQLDHLPQVLSISYGDSEICLCKGFTGDCNTTFNSNAIYTRRTNIEFMKLFMRGISILTSFSATACPYLTTVGATELIDIEYNRGFPDISAFGASGFFVINETYQIFGSTSMSAPLWNGIATILNSYSLKQTKH